MIINTDSQLYDPSQDEFIEDLDTRELGNELLSRAKEVSQKIEERVRALCQQQEAGSAGCPPRGGRT
jgi:hypothetical protein